MRGGARSDDTSRKTGRSIPTHLEWEETLVEVSRVTRRSRIRQAQEPSFATSWYGCNERRPFTDDCRLAPDADRVP